MAANLMHERYSHSSTADPQREGSSRISRAVPRLRRSRRVTSTTASLALTAAEASCPAQDRPALRAERRASGSELGSTMTLVTKGEIPAVLVDVRLPIDDRGARPSRQRSAPIENPCVRIGRAVSFRTTAGYPDASDPLRGVASRWTMGGAAPQAARNPHAARPLARPGWRRPPR